MVCPSDQARGDVEIERGCLASFERLPGDGAHGRVIGAVFDRRRGHPNVHLFRALLQPLAEP